MPEVSIFRSLTPYRLHVHHRASTRRVPSVVHARDARESAEMSRVTIKTIVLFFPFSAMQSSPKQSARALEEQPRAELAM